MISWPDPKDPNEVLPYTLDWLPRLGDDILIAMSTWAVANNDGFLVVISSDNTDTDTTIWLSGGTVGARYELTNTVTTDFGWTMEQSFRLRIRQK